MAFQAYDRVRSTGLFGVVIDPEAGEIANPGVTGGYEQVARVLWDDQDETALVRVSLLTKVAARRKTKAGRRA